MKLKINTIAKKITLLNDTILNSMIEKSDKTIVRDFTETGIKILEADFGFAWWKFSDSEKFKLAYKSPNTPYDPFLPRKRGGHYTAIKTKKPFFDNNVKKENYGLSDISPYMKSFIIIPICHGKHTYGGLTLCFKKQHNFTEEEITLSQSVGHATAQAITVHNLIEIDILLEQEKLKTEFIANATHELRTPLAIMKGNVDLALMGNGSNTESKNALLAVNDEINILSGILHDLALLTSSEKNTKYVLSESEVDIFNLLNQLIKRAQGLARDKKISIKIKIKKNYNPIVLGDKKYLEKLFLNLIKNAITYGKEKGSVDVEISGDKKIVTIKIIDTGIGISKEDLPKIFDRFYRADKAHSSGGNHSGLGLAIVKWVTDIHKGTISVKSTLDKGSVFIVNLPLKSN